MDRTIAITTWRAVCGSDMIMALPPTGRMLEEFAARIEAAEREAHAQEIERLRAEVKGLRARIEGAPVAVMDTRASLGICAPTEADFPAIYALQGKRVALVVVDE